MLQKFVPRNSDCLGLLVYWCFNITDQYNIIPKAKVKQGGAGIHPGSGIVFNCEHYSVLSHFEPNIAQVHVPSSRIFLLNSTTTRNQLFDQPNNFNLFCGREYLEDNEIPVEHAKQCISLLFKLLQFCQFVEYGTYTPDHRKMELFKLDYKKQKQIGSAHPRTVILCIQATSEWL